MGWATTSGLRGAMTRAGVVLAGIGIAAASAMGTANAQPNPNDPECQVKPWLPRCLDNPPGPDDPAPPPPPPPGSGIPTGPADIACISQPTNPICAGGPYAPPTPPPPPPPPGAPPPPPPPPPPPG
ncbi:hypothetical protein Q2100_27380, partial [Mycolicibacterium sp. KC 300]|nr:hypothetical protein [Mycolicibacterium arseniciresistens]